MRCAVQRAHVPQPHALRQAQTTAPAPHTLCAELVHERVRARALELRIRHHTLYRDQLHVANPAPAPIFTQELFLCQSKIRRMPEPHKHHDVL